MSIPEGADKKVIENLEMLGSDMERDHPVEFFLYFPDEQKANIVAAELMNLQFEVSVSYAEIKDEWLCFAIKKIKPSTERMVELSNYLRELAEKNDGNYDGWGTPVIDENYPEDENE